MNNLIKFEGYFNDIGNSNEDKTKLVIRYIINISDFKDSVESHSPLQVFKTKIKSVMLLADNILDWVVFNLKVHNAIATPLHKFSKADVAKLQVSKQTINRYIFRAVFGFFFWLCQLIQIAYVFRSASLKIHDVIQSVLLTGCVLFHFFILCGHFKNRQNISNLFNAFVTFEKQNNGKVKQS